MRNPNAGKSTGAPAGVSPPSVAATPKESVGRDCPPGGPTTARMAMVAIRFIATTARTDPVTMKKGKPRRMSFLADGPWSRSVKLRFRRLARRGCLTTLPQRSIRYWTFAKYRGGTSANFGRQAPRPPADFGRHGAVHDDRDGPAGEPSEDAPSGESEGRDACGDGGGEARSHGGSRPPRERLSPRSGVRGGGSNQSVRPAGPHGPSRGSGAVRIREERGLAAHDAPPRPARRESETARRQRGVAPPLLQSERPAGDRRPPGESRPVGRGRVPASRPHVRLRADVVSGRRERGGVRQPQGRHGHPDRGGPQSSGDRCAEGGIPGRPEGDHEPRGSPEELRPPEPHDEGALGRAERRRRLQRVPGARRGRVPRRGPRGPPGPRDLEGRVPGEDPRGADGVRLDAGGEEFRGPRGPRPPIRAAVVGLLRRKRQVAGPLRGMVRQVLRDDAGRTSRSRSTRERSTAISASCCPGSPASRVESGGSCRSGGVPRRTGTGTGRRNANSTSR